MFDAAPPFVTAEILEKPQSEVVSEERVELLCLARALYRLRRQRDRLFSAELFSDPNWDLLLDLFAAEQAGQRVSVTSAFIAASASPATANRCLRVLEGSGLVYREKDRIDGRRTYVRLTDEAIAAMILLLKPILSDDRKQLSTGILAFSGVKPINGHHIGA